MQGVIAAVPSPISGAGEFSVSMFLEHANWALNNGCDGLNILGSTGEASTFSVTERKAVMECAATHLPIEKLMVGTGTPALKDTVDLTLFAAELGYSAALVLPPFYYKPISDLGLARWYEVLDQKLGHSPLKIYFYNYPQMTGYQFSVDFISKLFWKSPSRLAGIKDSSGDMDFCKQIVEAVPDLNVFPSSETTLAVGATHGFAGCISATANITAPTCKRVWAAGNNASSEDISAAKKNREQRSPLIH